MKKLITIIGLAAALSLSASAQQYSAVALTGVTNSIAPAVATTANIGITNAATKNESLGLQCSFTCDSATTSNLTVVIRSSADGTKFDTQGANAFVWTIAENGTTEVVATTNLPSSWLGSLGFWKIGYITNAHATANATNFVIKVAKKPTRFGP